MMFIKMSDGEKAVTVKAEKIEIVDEMFRFYYGDMYWECEVYQVDEIWEDWEESE